MTSLQTDSTPRTGPRVVVEPAVARPSLLFFFSSTCGASRRVDSFLAQVLQRRANHSTFRLIRIDVDRRPDLLERLQVNEAPALVVFAAGAEQGRLVRPTGCSEISRLLSPWLK